MNNYLFVFEGGKTENVFYKSLEKHLLGKKFATTCVFGADIYYLYRELKPANDAGFDEDIFSVLKTQSVANSQLLAGRSKDSFAGVFLFFDYDAHATLADKGEKLGDEKIIEMLEFFDNDTENGMLFISYPMVEAIRHYTDYEGFRDLIVKCRGRNCSKLLFCEDADACLSEPGYKEMVGKESLPSLTNVNKYTQYLWKQIVQAHLAKSNYIVTGEYAFPSAYHSQKDIFQSQCEKYLSLECPQVAVLSAFPPFLLYYWGIARTRSILFE